MYRIWNISLILLLTTYGILYLLHNVGTGNKTGSIGQSVAPLSTDNYTYHVNLDDNYELQWNFNSTHIILKAHVKTNGYIGLGISDHGAMYPSDVIIAWVKDGQVHFGDRYATGHFLPSLDSQQDWRLVSGTEEGNYTTITMIRKLDTCDDEDFPISAGTTRLIYCYGPSDPTSDNRIGYHGDTTRGTKSVLLLDPPAQESKDEDLPSNVKIIEILNKNFSVPGTDTTYICTIWKRPPLDGKHHIIRYDPVIKRGHEKLVHHMILYFCSQDLDDKFVGTRHDCYNIRIRPRELDSCFHPFLGWGIGGTTFNYPPHVGHPIGTADDPTYFMLETHYDNVNMRSDYVDNSGLRIYLTKQLRQHDAGLMQVGVFVDKAHIIPPFSESFLSRGYCHQDCIAEAIGDKEIHIFSDLLHSHLIGKLLSTRIIRNGVELPPILEDKNYDFDYQEWRLLPEERTVKKGDTLITDCYFDSRQRKSITYGGLSTRDEMCLSFILYYPRIPLTHCASSLRYKIPRQFAGRGITDFVRHLDWTKKEVREEFSKVMAESDIFNVCWGTKASNFSGRLTSQPNITVPYKPVDQCKVE